ncbi:HIT-like protein [Rickenella mellea]|uniref:HIT-like protein n=1 Tax=Rickenella mellea TaxID=50990 RepID=A0A4Y7PQJ1_9AGAM|nr:HIT-like protein [Rickenella mellea]
MTSFIIEEQVGRHIPATWKTDPECPFCRIIQGKDEAHKIYENDKVIAILDILPLRPGHVLVMPKAHCSRLSELPTELAAAVGEAVTKIAGGLVKGMDCIAQGLRNPADPSPVQLPVMANSALNVVCNQEYAQAVPHVHYHIIPAPKFISNASSGREVSATPREMLRREFEARDQLDEFYAEEFTKIMRAKL